MFDIMDFLSTFLVTCGALTMIFVSGSVGLVLLIIGLAIFSLRFLNI